MAPDAPSRHPGNANPLTPEQRAEHLEAALRLAYQLQAMLDELSNILAAKAAQAAINRARRR